MKELRDGRYTLVRRLGEGSQGETWEAIEKSSGEKRSLADAWRRYVHVEKARSSTSTTTTTTTTTTGERLVAVKCFRVGRARAWKDVELAEREARTLASLDHPGLPRYVDHFEEDGTLYLVMEKIEGESLAAIRARGGSLAVAEVERMLEDVAGALGYLHGRAPVVVHRDIKPGNVIRRPDGSFVIVDFGAVRDSLKPEGGSTVVGTFGFMAPEQFQGRASPRSDVYGLGATAISMLAGCEPEKLPHVGLGIDVARAIPSSTPRGLARALAAMLEPDPDRRAASVDVALELLHARPRAPEPEPKPYVKRADRKRQREKDREARRNVKTDRRARKRGPEAQRRRRKTALVVGFLAVVYAIAFASAAPPVFHVLAIAFAAAALVSLFVFVMLSRARDGQPPVLRKRIAEEVPQVRVARVDEPEELEDDAPPRVARKSKK